jgi:branched-chain amino acid transport system ATP-binding protein
MLQTSDLTCRYGRVRAVDECTLSVPTGKVVTLLGANGAGKTTLLSGISGVLRPAGGRVDVDGTTTTGWTATRIVQHGVSHVPEGRRLFADETVLTNLRLGAHLCRRREEVESRLADVLERVPLLRDRLNSGAAALSGGQQQMLAMARGLMAAPRYLLLDEPFNGLSPVARLEVVEIVRNIAQRGAGVLVVEQVVDLALQMADHVYVMRGGRIVLDASPDEIRSPDDVYDAYVR